ncbi:MAG: DUF3667 domain-containing protein [Planctomycetes bacterium]|nr:DUF3667 domain-containing protein [Planctomycetota bacterium]
MQRSSERPADVASDTPSSLACPTCATPFDGPYCHQCGERKLRPGEFSFWFWLRALIARFTQLDGPFAKATISLFARPGSLTTDYFRGKRIPYARPIQYFLVANVIFFVVGAWLGIDTLSTPLRSHLRSRPSFHAQDARSWVENRLGTTLKDLEARGANDELTRSFLALSDRFDVLGDSLSRTLVFSLVPMFFAASFFLTRLTKSNRRRLVSEHFVSSLHFVGYFLLAQVLLFALFIGVGGIAEAFGTRAVRAFLLHDRALGPALAAFLVWYGYGAAQRFHGFGRPGAIVMALTLLPVSFGALTIYRSLLFYVTQWQFA